MDEENGPYSHNPGDNWNNKASSEELNNKEKSFYHPGGSTAGGKDSKSVPRSSLYKSEGRGGLTKGVVSVAAKVNPAARTLKFIGKHKGATGLAGGITGFIIIVAFFFAFLAAHILITIEQDITKYEEKGVSFVVRTAADHLMNSVACRKLGVSISGCRSKPSPSEEAADDEDPLGKEIDNFDLEAPKVEQSLKNSGIAVEEQDGKVIGLEDEDTGQALTSQDFSEPSIVDDLGQPAWNVAQRSIAEPLAIDDAGSTFNVITSPTDDADSDVERAATGQDQGEQLPEAQAEDEDKSGTTEQQTADQTLADTDSSMLNAADQVIQAGGTEPQAVSAAQRAAGLGTIALINTLLEDVCSLRSVTLNAANGRTALVDSELIRQGTTLDSMANEEQVGGTITGKQNGAISNLFSGNPKYNAASTDPTQAEAAEPFDKSAAWQRIEGNPVDTNKNTLGYNPDLESAVLPQATAGVKMADQIISDADTVDPTLPLTCIAENNVVSRDIISLGLGVVQGLFDGLSFGTGQLAIMAGVAGFQETIKHEVIPDLVKYFTPVMVDGLQNSVQWLNEADAGNNLLFNLMSMRMGGEPLTGGQATSLNVQGGKLQQYASKPSFFDRVFSFNNPDSLVSHLAVSLPLSRLGMVRAFFADIINAPSMLFHSFGLLLEGSRAYAASQATNPGQAYGLTQYGFSSASDINEYDPIQNEQYLYNTNLTYSGVSESLIQLLGNPNNFPNASPDPSTNDILHCFTQDYFNVSNPSSSPGGQLTPNNICGTMGSFDDTNDPPKPISPQNVVTSFCSQLPPPTPGEESCPDYVFGTGIPYVVMGHFQQYLLDTEVMGNLTSLTNNNQ